jgi:hypothetical protein
LLNDKYCPIPRGTTPPIGFPLSGANNTFEGVGNGETDGEGEGVGSAVKFPERITVEPLLMLIVLPVLTVGVEFPWRNKYPFFIGFKVICPILTLPRKTVNCVPAGKLTFEIFTERLRFPWASEKYLAEPLGVALPIGAPLRFAMRNVPTELSSALLLFSKRMKLAKQNRLRTIKPTLEKAALLLMFLSSQIGLVLSRQLYALKTVSQCKNKIFIEKFKSNIMMSLTAERSKNLIGIFETEFRVRG